MGTGLTPLWASADIEKVIGKAFSAPWTCSGISIDTRTLQRGDFFVPLLGETGDGHKFLSEAVRKGAVGAFVSGDSHPNLPYVTVSNTLHALEKLGEAARERSSALRIGVTGSVGKTGTKEMLKAVLSNQGPIHSNVSSYNNQWGVPLTLARMPQDTAFSVFEIGMNKAGEIRALTSMVRPHIALITTIAEAHTAFFKSTEDIARAKGEIFEHVESGGRVLLNQDNAYFPLLVDLAKAQKLSIFSFGKQGDFRLISYNLGPTSSTIQACIAGQNLTYTLPIPGIHWVMNSLAVLGAVFLADADVKQAAENFATLSAPPGRGQRFEGLFTLIDESYNANPASMQAALDVLGKSNGRRKIAILGDMRELGNASQQYHKDLLTPLLANEINKVYCCGPYMEALFEEIPAAMQGAYALTSQDLIPFVVKDIEPGDTVMIKGSLGTRMKPIVDALQEKQTP